MRNVLIIQYSSVLMKLYQVNRQRRYFRNHDSPQCIGDTRVSLTQDEFDFMGRHVKDLDFGKALMRHGEILAGNVEESSGEYQ